MGFFWVLIFGPIRSSLSLEIRSTRPGKNPRPFYRLWRPSVFNGQVIKRSFKLHQNESTIYSRTPEKEAKPHVTLTWNFPWKSCSTTHLLSFNPEVLKAFPTKMKMKMKPPKTSKIKKTRQKKSEKSEEERKRKVKVKTAASLLNPRISKFCFLCMPELFFFFVF